MEVKRSEPSTLANSAFGQCFNLKGETSQEIRKFKFVKKFKQTMRYETYEGYE